MKTRFVLLALAIIGFAQCAAGQTARWRFTIPAPAYQKDVTQVTLVANDGSGGAVFQVTDYRQYPPSSGITGLETAGHHLIWLSRTGTLLHTLTSENLEGSLPSPILLTPTVLQIKVPNSAGQVIKLHRLARRGHSVVVTTSTPPADESLAFGENSITTADPFGHFTLKKVGESVTEIVRYSH